MDFHSLYKIIISRFKTPRFLESAFKTMSHEIKHSFIKYIDLPPGKIEIPLKVKSIVFPVPAVICGSLSNGKPNFNMLGNFGLISPIRPNPIVYISSSKTHYTNIGIRQNMMFSVNIPSRSIMAQADYLGVVSGRTTDKSNKTNVFFGIHKNVPCMAECPINFVCKVIKHLVIKEKDLFIAEIVESYITENFLKEDLIDIELIEPLLYTADGYYRIPSHPVGKAYKEFKNFKGIV